MLDGGNNNDDVIGQRAGTQARTALESVQEFQVITNQFDAQFGRTTGAIINAVTKSGTNAFRGSAFAFAQDAELDREGLLRQERRRRPQSEQAGHPAPGVRRHARRPDRQGPRALLRQPRARHDRPRRRLVFPTRPDLNWSPTTQDRVWNTLARSISSSAPNTRGACAICARPRRSAIRPSARSRRGAIREEDDKDQTVSAAVIGVRQHRAELAARRLDAGGRLVRATPASTATAVIRPRATRRWPSRRSPTSRATVAQARVNDAYQIENTFSWFVPGQARRSRHQARRRSTSTSRPTTSRRTT